MVRLGVHVSTAKCLMENSDLIAWTSYGKHNGENTITSIEHTPCTEFLMLSFEKMRVKLE